MFLKKNVSSALMVVKQMKEAGVKPDSITYGYLINNCNREDAITNVKIQTILFPNLCLLVLLNLECVNAITSLFVCCE